MQWKDVQELGALFRTEGLQTQYGKFFDQRFVDYLHRNFDEIGDIHWRQFESLCAEFFHQIGFEVELGPGRNDNGIDVRAWAKNSSDDSPPVMIVQW